MTTTVLDSIMTLLQYAPAANDDQQVPDTQSVVAPVKKSTKTKPHIPDFGSLLLDAQNNNTALNTPELIHSIAYPDSEHNTTAAEVDFNASLFMEKTAKGECELDELSLYDGFSLDPLKKPGEEEEVVADVKPMVIQQGMKQEDPSILLSTSSISEVVRPSTLPLSTSSQALPPLPLPQYQADIQYDISPVSSASSFDPNSPTSNPQLLSEMESCQQKVDAICKYLWITKDPFRWTTEQVQKWAQWVLKEHYGIEVTHLPNFQMDGTSLCMLSKDDFVSRNQEVGNYLYAELDWWKTVAMSPSPEHEERMIYTDLTNSTTTTSPTVTSSMFTNTASAPMPVPTTAPMSTAEFINSISMTMSSPMTSPSMSSSPAQPQQPQQPQQQVMTSTTPSSSSPYTLSVIPTPVLHDLDVNKSLCQLNNELNKELNNVNQQHHHHQPPPPQYPSYLDQLQWDDATMTATPNTSSCDSSMNSMDFSLTGIDIKKEVMEEEDEDEEEEASSSSTGDRRSYVSHSKHTIHLWQFLKNLLQYPDQYGSYIKWLDHAKGIFKIENSVEVAKLWGRRKNRPAMNYDKLSRSIRQYYRKGIIKKTSTSKRLVYQFQPTYL